MSDDGGNYLYRLMRDQAGPEGLARTVRTVDHARVLDLGHDVRVMFTVREDGGPRTGLMESHQTPNGQECACSITFDVPEAEGLSGPRWQLVSLDPLHVEPSILCSCGHHGFIRNGQWVSA